MSLIQQPVRAGVAVVLSFLVLGALVYVQIQSSNNGYGVEGGLVDRKNQLFNSGSVPISPADRLCPPACAAAIALVGVADACTCSCSSLEMKLKCEDICGVECNSEESYCAATTVFVEFVLQNDVFVYGNSYIEAVQVSTESANFVRYTEEIDYDNGGAQSCSVSIDGDECTSCSIAETTRVVVDTAECFEPSASPSMSAMPTLSAAPSTSPTSSPSGMPSDIASGAPSMDPTSSMMPSITASEVPSVDPTSSMMPSVTPSSAPSAMPSGAPSAAPSPEPTASAMPSKSPAPSSAPSASSVPSVVPSSVPTVCGQEIFQCPASFGLLGSANPEIDCTNIDASYSYDLCLDPDLALTDPLAFLGSSADAVTCVALSRAMAQLRGATIEV